MCITWEEYKVPFRKLIPSKPALPSAFHKLSWSSIEAEPLLGQTSHTGQNRHNVSYQGWVGCSGFEFVLHFPVTDGVHMRHFCGRHTIRVVVTGWSGHWYHHHHPLVFGTLTCAFWLWHTRMAGTQVLSTLLPCPLQHGASTSHSKMAACI